MNFTAWCSGNVKHRAGMKRNMLKQAGGCDPYQTAVCSLPVQSCLPEKLFLAGMGYVVQVTNI